MKTKKFKTWLALALSLLMLLAFAVGCTDKTADTPDPGDDEGWQGNWNGPDVEPEEPEVHLCSHACYVCGKCLNADCEDPVCAEKCYENEKETRKEYVFNGADPRVKLEGGVNIEGDHLGNINQNPNVKITYKVIAPADITVCMGVSVSEMYESNFITADTPITVNGEPFYSRGEVKGGDTVWTNFVTCWLGCVDLQEGENTIVITNNENAATTTQYNFKDLMFLSSAELEWGQANEQHECTSKNEAGKCTDYDCNRAECLDKEEKGWKKLNIYGKDDEVLKYYYDENGDEHSLWNDAENEKCIGYISGNDWGQVIVWSFNATEETYLRLSLETSTNLVNSLYSDAWDMTFNGNPIETEGKTTAPAEGVAGGWAVYTFGTVAYVKAAPGINTFVMEHKGVLGYNLRSLDITYAEGEIAKAQAEKPEGPEPQPPAEDPITDGTEYFFEGENAVLSGGEKGEISVNEEDLNAKNNSSLSNFNLNYGARLVYGVHADKAGKAGLYVRLALGSKTVEGNQGNPCIPGVFTLAVNGRIVETPASLTAQGNADWVTYEDYWLANIDLSAGDNTVVLTVAGACGNYDYMKLISPASLTAAEPPAAEPPVTEGEGYVFEGETAEMANGATGAFTVNNGDANAKNNTSLGNVNNNFGATLTFTVNAEKDCKAALSVCLALGAQKVANGFYLTVNGENIVIPSLAASQKTEGWTPWATYEDFWLANVELTAGENTIVLTVTGGCGNFDYLKLLAPQKLTAPQSV